MTVCGKDRIHLCDALFELTADHEVSLASRLEVVEDLCLVCPSRSRANLL